MNIFPDPCSVLPMSSFGYWHSMLEKNGYKTLVIKGSCAINRRGFFDEIRAKCPLEPLSDFNNMKWSALGDSLWGGLQTSGWKSIAFLWTDSHLLRKSDADAWQTAILVLGDVRRALGSSDGEEHIEFLPILFAPD